MGTVKFQADLATADDVVLKGLMDDLDLARPIS